MQIQRHTCSHTQERHKNTKPIGKTVKKKKVKIKILQRLRHGIIGHGTLKTPSCSFLLPIYLLLRVICFPRETASQSTSFSFAGSYPFEIADDLGLGPQRTSAFSSRTPSTADRYRPWACCPSLCEFVGSSFLLWLGLVSLVLSISPGSYTLCLLFCGLLSSERRYLILFRAKDSDISLWMLSGWGSVYLFSFNLEESFSVMVEHSKNYEYSVMSLGIVLLMCSLCGTVVFRFLLGPSCTI